MNTDFIIGALIASCLWAIFFVGFLDFNYRMMQRAMNALEGYRLGNEAGMRLIGQELDKAKIERDAWQIEAETLKARLAQFEIGEGRRMTPP